jgi:hypothetical protein
LEIVASRPGFFARREGSLYCAANAEYVAWGKS